jgi:hypothetical protein
MVSSRKTDDSASEALLAELTEAAYAVALRHGISGPFIDVELDLWRALRGVLSERAEEMSCAR